jgi:hypothetical protein
MSTDIADAPLRQAAMTPRQAAVTAGLAYVIIILLGVFSGFFVFRRFIRADDAPVTVGNIVNSELLFRVGIAAFIIVLIADVVVAWALYVLFQRTSQQLSLFAAWFRLVYVAIAAAALLNLFVALKLADDAGSSTALAPEQRDAQVRLSLAAFDYGWTISLVFFGVHLLLLGVVIAKSDYAPRLLGILVAIAGSGYVLGYLPRVLVPGHEDLFILLPAVLTVAGEVIALPSWLLWKGGRSAARPQHAGHGAPAPR